MTANNADSFGDLLRRARRAASLSQEELAERAGLSARAISALERGVNRVPRRDTLEMLAGALDLPADERTAWERARRNVAKREAHGYPKHRAVAPTPGIPAPLTPLVGREREIDDVRRLLRHEGLRLVTVTGPGGVGKTRLVIAVAHEIAADYPDGVTFIDLSALSDPDLVLPSIVTTLGISTAGARPVLDVLIDAMRQQQRLLAVDNFEHVAAASVSVGALLAGCPGLSIVTTSRVPLRIQGEQEYPLSALDLPGETGLTDPQTALRSPAVQLFVQRARAIRPEFRLTADTTSLVVAICSRLDGLPLAIELAAARTRALSLQGILQRMEHRLDLLVERGESLPPRQRTIRGAIQWSYDLLSPEQQQLARALSVFRGGATLEAISAVAGVDEQRDNLHDLEELVKHSLVQLRELPDGSLRYAMLETIREFGSERLDASPEADQIHDRHADFFVDLAQHAGAHLDGRDRRDWLRLLDLDHDNLRDTINYLREHRDAARGLRMVGALGRYWFSRGYFAEGRAHVSCFLDMTDDTNRSQERAEALLRLAWLAAFQGDAPNAISASEDALAIMRGLGTSATLSESLLVAGIAHGVGGNGARAVTLWEEAVPTASAAGDFNSHAMALNNLAVMARLAGRHDDAARQLRDALEVCRRGGNGASASLVLGNLASIELDSGRIDDAETLMREALSLDLETTDRWHFAQAILGFAGVAVARRQWRHAACLHGAVEALHRTIGHKPPSLTADEIELDLATLRSALGDDEFESSIAEGRAYNVEQAISAALRARSVDEQC
jgi:predicted ATPase/DNA-binding XRE family transcriptional regulator